MAGSPCALVLWHVTRATRINSEVRVRMITSREVSTMTQSGLIGNGLSHTSCKLRETPGWQAHSARVEYRSSWVLLTPLVCDIGKMKNGSGGDRKSTRLNSSHTVISYAVFCFKKKKKGSLAEHSPGSAGTARTSRFASVISSAERHIGL